MSPAPELTAGDPASEPEPAEPDRQQPQDTGNGTQVASAESESAQNAHDGADEGPDADADLDDEDFPFLGGMGEERWSRHRAFYAAYSTINFGSVSGGQQVTNQGEGPAGGRRSPAREGPIFPEEILAAGEGFAEPAWFADALRHLDSHLLLLAGAPGTGRRTAALNLLHRHSRSMALCAVDGTVDLREWRPPGDDVRGYLVDGLSRPQQLLEGWLVNQLVGRLRAAKARMVIVLPEVPGLLRELKRAGTQRLTVCEPPPTRAMFTARFEAQVPDEYERERLLAALGPRQLDGLLAQELSPAHVAELVDEIVHQSADFAAIEERLSFLAEQEVPKLLEQLRERPGSLAFLLATCVFEGLDCRVVREQAGRLLELADGRLDAWLPGSRDEEESRPNPRYVFEDSMERLLQDVGARQMPPEVRSASAYDYTVEPVRFTRHGRGEAVLRHVWREYGRSAELMTEWLMQARSDRELVEPIGEVMGMAANWGGGRRALEHVGKLARSPRASTRKVAASAMGIAARDPVLAGEVRHRLTRWSRDGSRELRATVAYTCATEYGASRPDHALRLVGHLMEGHDADAPPVARAVTAALRSLFVSGHRTEVIERLSEWADEDGGKGALALASFTHLLRAVPWYAAQLPDERRVFDLVAGLLRRALDDDEHFERARSAIESWRRMAAVDEPGRETLEALLATLAQGMRHGALRLFVSIDRDQDDNRVGKDIARRALHAWRSGQAPPRSGTDPDNGDRTGGAA